MRLDDDSLTDIREYIAEEIGKQILIKLGCAFAMFALFSIWLPLSLIGPQRDSSGISSMFPNFILVFSVLMFLMAISELRTPRRVVLTGSHILIEGWLTRILLRWSDIHEIRIDDKSEYGKREKLRVLTLMDSRGKKCGQINSNIRGYASLEKQIQSRSSASRGSATLHPEKETRRHARDKRKGKRLSTIVISGIFIISMIPFVDGIAKYLEVRKIEKEGVLIEARIQKYYLYKGIAPRLEFSYTTPDGQTITKDVLMEHPDWKILDGAKTVKVKYLPNEVGTSRLLTGENREFYSKLEGLGIFAGIIVLSLGGIILICLGYDPEQLMNRRLVKSTPRVESPPSMEAQALNFSQEVVGEVIPPFSGLPSGWKVIVPMAFLIGGLGAAIGLVAIALIYLMSRSGGLIAYPLLSIAWKSGDLILAVLLIVSAAGIHRARSWGRHLALGVAAFQILSSIGMLLRFYLVILPSGYLFSQQSQNLILPLKCSSVLLVIWWLMFPTMLLILLNLRGIREEFKRI